jgi:hypothetical protein
MTPETSREHDQLLDPFFSRLCSLLYSIMLSTLPFLAKCGRCPRKGVKPGTALHCISHLSTQLRGPRVVLSHNIAAKQSSAKEAMAQGGAPHSLDSAWIWDIIVISDNVSYH